MNSIADHAMTDDLYNDNVSKANTMQRVLASIRQFATIAELIRLLGAIGLIASMVALVLNGWSEGEDTMRYLKLLSMTAVLAVGGLFSSHFLKENKGARMFFGLSLISVPANFCILGALIFSLVSDPAVLTAYPGFAKWVASNLLTITIISTGAVIILVPITVLCFRIFSNGWSNSLAAYYLGLNGLLLLPIRDPFLIGLGFSIAALTPVLLLTRISRNDLILNSLQGKFVMITLFIPATLLLVRNLYLYQLDSFLGLVFAACSYLVCRQWYIAKQENGGTRQIVECISIVSGFAVAWFSAGVVAENQLLFLQDFMGVVMSLVLGALLVDFNANARDSRFKDVAILVTALSLFVVVLGQLFFSGSAMTSFVCLVMSVAMFGFGLFARRKSVSAVGMLIMLASIWVGFSDLFHFLLIGNWLALAIFGGVFVLLGSLVDRYGASLRFQFANRFNQSRQVSSEAENFDLNIPDPKPNSHNN